MEEKERAVTPEEFKKLVQSQKREFIIHVELGKEAAAGGDKRGKPALSRFYPLSEGCADHVGA